MMTKILRVAWIVAAGLMLSTAAWGITIPITGISNTGLSSPTIDAYGGITGGTLIQARNPDPEWTFYTFSGSLTNVTSATANTAYVVRSDRAPLTGSPAAWAPNSSLSQWISAQSNPCAGVGGQGNNSCQLPTTTVTSYLVATTFNIPAMTNPPNLPQWWLVMSGTVWADDNIGGIALFSGTTPVGTPVYSQVFSTPISGPLTPANFSMQTWVNPNQTYTLAFLLNNTANTWSSFRLQFTEVYVTPEPGAWLTMATAGVGLAFAAWRRRQAKKSNA